MEYRIHTFCSAVKNGTVVRRLWIQRIAFHSPNFASKILVLTDGEDRSGFLDQGSIDDTMYDRFGKFEERNIPNLRGGGWVTAREPRHGPVLPQLITIVILVFPLVSPW